MIAGFAIKPAAGITAAAVIPPSFTALVPHLQSAEWHVGLTLALIGVGVLGSFGGAWVSSRYAPDAPPQAGVRRDDRARHRLPRDHALRAR